MLIMMMLAGLILFCGLLGPTISERLLVKMEIGVNKVAQT